MNLPGDIEGLLRRGSPVVPRGATDPDHQGVVVHLIPASPPGVIVSWMYAGGWPDLHTGSRLWLDPVLYVDNQIGHDWDRRELWRILRKAGRIYDWLERLDVRDPRLLEDGSRWVDAEALRLVCLHVAGRS